MIIITLIIILIGLISLLSLSSANVISNIDISNNNKGLISSLLGKDFTITDNKDKDKKKYNNVLSFMSKKKKKKNLILM